MVCNTQRYYFNSDKVIGVVIVLLCSVHMSVTLVRVSAGVQNYDGTDTPVWAEPGNQRAQDIAAAVQTIEDTSIQLIDTDQYGNMTHYLLDRVRKRPRLVVRAIYIQVKLRSCTSGGAA